MSDFNVTKLENGDFEVTKSHRRTVNFLFGSWVLFIIAILLISFSSCSTRKQVYKSNTRVSYCKHQMY
jgi:hypothetical protein